MRLGPVKSGCTLNLGTFQFKPLQGRHLSKADKNFCPVSVRFKEVLLYIDFQNSHFATLSSSKLTFILPTLDKSKSSLLGPFC